MFVVSTLCRKNFFRMQNDRVSAKNLFFFVANARPRVSLGGGHAVRTRLRCPCEPCGDPASSTSVANPHPPPRPHHPPPPRRSQAATKCQQCRRRRPGACARRAGARQGLQTDDTLCKNIRCSPRLPGQRQEIRTARLRTCDQLWRN